MIQAKNPPPQPATAQEVEVIDLLSDDNEDLLQRGESSSSSTANKFLKFWGASGGSRALVKQEGGNKVVGNNWQLLGCPLHWTLFYLKKIYSL
jgi:hypothetical protein